ncbi:hypothetical protein A20C1_10790 [marine actinobacterium PHSC20C1]|nr:hypothetical protein A20C1_10790 [marine actinobacterium PHSC20C1]
MATLPEWIEFGKYAIAGSLLLAALLGWAGAMGGMQTGEARSPFSQWVLKADFGAGSVRSTETANRNLLRSNPPFLIGAIRASGPYDAQPKNQT